MLLLLNDVRLPSVRFSPGPAMVRFTLDRLARAAVVDRAAVGGLQRRQGPAVGLREARQRRHVQDAAGAVAFQDHRAGIDRRERGQRHRAAGQGLELGLRLVVVRWPSVTLDRLASVSVLPVPVASSVVVPPLPV